MDSEKFVREDVFDARISALQQQIDATNKRIDDLSNNINHNNSIMGIALTLFAIFMAGIQVAIALIPYITSAPK